MDIKEIIKNLELIIDVTPDYIQGRRRGLTDDETEMLAYRAVYQAVEILEKLVSTLEDFREWILVNYEPAIVDLVAITVVSHGKVNGWDEIDVDEMLEELHYELKKGLLNVIDTFLKD